jgi:hypothetical protein
MCLAQTWHIPGVDLPRTPACPAASARSSGRGRFSRAAARTRSPSARRAAAPTARPVPPPAPAPGRLPPHYRRPAAAAPPGPPRSLASTRTTPPAVRTATVTVSPAAPEPPCRTLFPNSSPAARPSSPHVCPDPGTPAVNARATRARSGRPATVTLSRTTALATSAPAFPGPPRGPGNHPGPQPGTRGMHARPGGPR